MKKGYAVLLLFALFAATVLSEDITTIDGTVYKDIKVTEITPIGINFVSNDKACWADFRDLSPDVAAKYGYDPAKAAEFEKALAQNQGSAIAGDPSEIAADSTVTGNDTVPAVAPAPVQGTNVTVNTPVANANITIAPPPPQVIVVNNGDTVIYDQQIVYEPVTTIWVSWCGRYYPRSYWHYWYWKDRYVCWNGRYYPAHCYYRGGVWDHGKYYKYAPDQRRNFPSGNRDSRLSYSAHSDNRGVNKNNNNRDTAKINAVNSENRNINPAQTTISDSRKTNPQQSVSRAADNKNQAVISDNRVANQVQTVNSDSRARVQNVVYENRKTVPAVQVDNQNSARTQNVANDSRVANQVQTVNSDNRARVQNVVYENRKTVPAVQADNQNSARTQNVANDNHARVQNTVYENRKQSVDNQNSVKTQIPVKDNRASVQTVPVVTDNRTRGVANETPRVVQPSHIPAVTPAGSDNRGTLDNAGDNNRGGDRGEGRR